MTNANIHADLADAMKELHFVVNAHAKSFNLAEANAGENDPHEQLPSSEALGLDDVYTFKYTYPLTKPALFEHKLTPEMSLLSILELGRQDYEKIYASEEDPGHIPGMLNRRRSAGPYGIWGHDFEDLYFEGIVFAYGNNISFEMGS